MCPEELITLVSALAIAIAKESSSDELAIYAAIFSMLGDTLNVFAVQCDFLNSRCENTDP